MLTSVAVSGQGREVIHLYQCRKNQRSCRRSSYRVWRVLGDRECSQPFLLNFFTVRHFNTIFETIVNYIMSILYMYVCNTTCGMFLGLTIWCQIANWSPADFHLGLRPGHLSHILAHLLSSSLSSCLVVMLMRLYGVASDIPSRQSHSKLGSSASNSLSNPSIMIPSQELCCGCLSWNWAPLPCLLNCCGFLQRSPCYKEKFP